MYKVISSSQIGKRHEVNQDYTAFRHLPDGATICAVADGLGSCAKSDQGAKQAADVYLDSFFTSYAATPPADEDGVFELLSTAANVANRLLSDLPTPEEFFTTLSVAFITDHKLYYFHSGDGAIIQIRTDGIVRVLTTEQKGSFCSSVYPFQSEAGSTTWEYGTIDIDSDTLSVLCVTDGVLSALKKEHDTNPELRFYTKLLRGLYGNDPVHYLDTCLAKMEVSDDKTMSVILNTTFSKSDVPEAFTLAEAPILMDSLYEHSVTAVLADFDLDLRDMERVENTNLFFRNGIFVYPRFDIDRIYMGKKENLVGMVGEILSICFENKEDIKERLPDNSSKYCPIYSQLVSDFFVACYLFKDFLLLSTAGFSSSSPWHCNPELFLSHTHPITETLVAALGNVRHTEE